MIDRVSALNWLIMHKHAMDVTYSRASGTGASNPSFGCTVLCNKNVESFAVNERRMGNGNATDSHTLCVSVCAFHVELCENCEYVLVRVRSRHEIGSARQVIAFIDVINMYM